MVLKHVLFTPRLVGETFKRNEKSNTKIAFKEERELLVIIFKTILYKLIVHDICERITTLYLFQ